MTARTIALHHDVDPEVPRVAVGPAPLTSRDAAANNILDAFDLTQAPPR
jgi:hypothetical protein